MNDLTATPDANNATAASCQVFSNSVGTSESRAALSWSGVERRSVSRAAVTSGGKSIEPTADDIASATDRSVDGGGGGGGGGTRAFSLVLVVLVTVFLLNLGENPLADDRSSAPQAAISNLMVPVVHRLLYVCAMPVYRPQPVSQRLVCVIRP
mmetsp:Transcript_36890/g.83004  ORF Transcript_36890/g.83004 Transcript_36890/m.83004 type:complete len:153 (-) Transcript_36890:11-469(-)